MSTMTGTIIALLLAASLSLVLTLLVEAHAERLGLVKAPNERSSHARPTPRGGGLGLVVVSSVLMLVLGLSGTPELAVVALLGAIVGAIGFADDILELPASLRMAIQVFCVVTLVWALAPAGPWLLLFEVPSLVYAALLLSIVAGVWWVNLYNFMDGIDGIAASQAVLILIGGAVLTAVSYTGEGKAHILLAMMGTAAATGGFLIRNLPPAKVFMGDVASTFLAFALCAFCLITVSGGVAIPAWLILGAAFSTDATTTLIRRLARGEHPTQAHRRHAYQQLSRRWGHRGVTLAYAAVTMVWSCPLAALAQWSGASSAWFVALVAHLPLVGLCVLARGGAKTETPVSAQPV